MRPMCITGDSGGRWWQRQKWCWSGTDDDDDIDEIVRKERSDKENDDRLRG